MTTNPMLPLVDPDYLIMEHDPDQAARLRARASPSAAQSFAQLLIRDGQGCHGMARRRLCRRPSSAGTGDGWAHCRGGEMESASQLIQEDPGEE